MILLKTRMMKIKIARKSSEEDKIKDLARIASLLENTTRPTNSSRSSLSTSVSFHLSFTHIAPLSDLMSRPGTTNMKKKMKKLVKLSIKATFLFNKLTISISFRS